MINPENLEINAPFASFESMGIHLKLHPKIQQGIKALGYKVPTDIQKSAIPEIIQGRDLMASAETGSGKTVAFVVPILQRLLSESSTVEGSGPQVLILSPTRELANQITDAIAAVGKFCNFRFGLITGGVPYPAQEQLLRRPIDLLVATPGRLMDHMARNRVNFSRLKILVLDEADRMLDMGFIQDIETIMSAIAKALSGKPQILLFSATLEGSVQKISRKFLRDPACIQLASSTKKHSSISHRIHLVDNWNHKRALLTHILNEPDMWQAVVFTATKRGADELVDELSGQGLNCAALHGDMKQSKRTRTLDQMHSGKVRVLVATDVAARGIDLDLSHMVNFDMPRTGEDYLHRTGRVGRGGKKGIAISLVGPNDGSLLAQIERFTGQRLERQVVPGFESRCPAEARRAAPAKKSNPHKKRYTSANQDRSFHAPGKTAPRTASAYAPSRTGAKRNASSGGSSFKRQETRGKR